ncbi:uncharacterized protein C2845_PM08G24990 [Panicum miliaceum]|uniref:Uncharacterized protein n=1 Tax=Panicum miliaceum TaxID=4540 RepID=A0A3L6R0L3_PANMI|nr:uncharacterized protein C2845_PM08G24990 [Panicum miliaceum]
MGGFSGATGLPVYREEDDEELFETSSSISGDSDDEDQFSNGEGAGALEHQFMQQAASPAQQPVRRLNSDSLYDLSSMMAQLPVKKGLSKYYDGKSQSFACMSEVRCLEDLRKKETPFKKIKPSRSYGFGSVLFPPFFHSSFLRDFVDRRIGLSQMKNRESEELKLIQFQPK